MNTTHTLSQERIQELLKILKTRFEKNSSRHKDLDWSQIGLKLENNPEKLWTLSEMENTSGEPDVVDFGTKTAGEYTFIDCSSESPKGRRSLCYDLKALESRKENKPKDSAMEMATNMGIELLTEEEYRALQKFGEFDTKTSSWIQTPESIRKLGGALFCDCRYQRVFVYHNGAESYYAVRGFRGKLNV